MSAILAVEGLRSGYHGAEVLRGVSLTLSPGEILAVLGKNGMGKTTLLKTVMGFVRTVAGRVTFDGADVTGTPPQRIARAGVAYTPQDYTIFQELTVEENLRLGVPDDRLYRERMDIVADAFPRIAERRRQRAGTLSGGEQKMLIMSRALIARPKVMLVDEISEGLQPTMIDRMAEVLARVRDAGTAVLIVEQHLHFALGIADRYAVLKLGEIVDEGSPAEGEARVAEYLKV
jgi:branched-chain amino acid transport system ATP-binding protein